MDKVGCSQTTGRVLKKGKKKQAKDELDRQKQAEKKKRRLEKALANSAAIISELEKKKQKKREEQKRLDEEGAAIAEAVALHVLIGEDTEEPCHLKLNKHRRYSHWGNSSNADSSSGGPGWAAGAYDSGARWTDWGIISRPLPSWGQVRELRPPSYRGAGHGTDICPGFVAAQAVSSLQIAEDSRVVKSLQGGNTGNSRLNLYREL